MIKTPSLASLALFPLVAVGGPGTAPPRPNIVFVLADDLRWNTNAVRRI